MWALAQAGVEVPTGYWQFVDAAWHRQQTRAGAWGYKPVWDPADPTTFHEPGATMTAAGVATLFITQEYLQIAPRCGGNIDDPAIDAGLRFLGTHLDPLPDYDRYYLLFGVSRVGLASGYKYLGATDWFRWGSDALCREQSPDGGWLRLDTGNDNARGVPNTSFALLFLSRGRAPVMMNKLDYDGVAGAANEKPAPGLWNQRPRDVANLARWVGKQIESPLNWQVVTLHQSAEDLHDAPILYMAGGKAPKLSSADVGKLRTYLQDGGLLLGHADCGSSEFAAGFKRLGEQLFPRYKFRPLEPTSPIYTNETFPRTSWHGSKPTVDALGNGARELMVLIPTGDPAREWQAQSFQSARKDVAGQFMIDLFLYAVDKEGLRQRDVTYRVTRRESVPPAKPAVSVARLKYAGNWDPEPGGWRRLANVLHNSAAAELTVDAIDPAKLNPTYALASLTFGGNTGGGNNDAKLTDAARAAIRDYVRSGGTLLVDVAGGRSESPPRGRGRAGQAVPRRQRRPARAPPDDPVFAAAGPALSARSVDYRRFERAGRNPHVPQLRGLTIGGRTAVFYSPEDVSVGLVGQPIDGVTGYAPPDATKVAADVIAYAAAHATKR